jgi:ABC-type multidrug transport system ATPase subunit
MIAVEEVTARRAPLALTKVSIAWGTGVHSLLGGREEGAPLLLALMAGSARARSGRVRVLDHAPDDARVRPAVAWVPMPAPLPEGLRVREVLRLAETLRGEARRPPEERLAALGIEPLAARPVKSLSRAEARAVALAEAITSTRTRVLLLEEPLLGVDPRAVARIPAALRARGREGCAVVVATGSTDDAALLADDHVLLRGGKVVGPATSIEALLGAAPDGARLRVLARSASDARRLVAAVSGAESGGAIDAVEQEGPAVQARGRDPVALARAIARAVAASHVDVVELRFGAPPIDAMGENRTPGAPAAAPPAVPPPMAPPPATEPPVDAPPLGAPP